MTFFDNTIFTFGSNTQGRHGKGTALIALKKYGAIYGQAEGLQGSSYGIITKELRKNKKKVTLKEISEGVKRFLKFAKSNKHLTFKVTAIGCGEAKRTPKQIGPFFRDHPKNVTLPKEFKKWCRSLEDRFFIAWKKKCPTLPKPVRQYQFKEDRKWKLDFAWPEYKLGVDIQGGGFIRGGHNRGGKWGQQNDFEKQREAARAGWIMLLYGTADIGPIDSGGIYKVVEDVATFLTKAQEI